jgi:serine/threonine protein kinase
MVSLSNHAAFASFAFDRCCIADLEPQSAFRDPQFRLGPRRGLVVDRWESIGTVRLTVVAMPLQERRPALRSAEGPICIGQDLGPYRIDALLGSGGMGIVYRATDRDLQRTVAIKVVAGMESDADARRWLLQEARLAAALSHPSICGVHEVGHLGDQPFIVMEHVAGSPLATLITKGNGLTLETALHYAIQIVDGVAHAHHHGIVHRDLKSSNIMIAPDGRAKILDFGLAVRQVSAAEASDAETTRSPDVPSGAGTVPYMAPELLRGRPADTRSDIWALGVLLQEMITGRRPFRGATRYELAAAILGEPAIPLPQQVPASMRHLVSRCLAKNPADRYQLASELAGALRLPAHPEPACPRRTEGVEG